MFTLQESNETKFGKNMGVCDVCDVWADFWPFGDISLKTTEPISQI